MPLWAEIHPDDAQDSRATRLVNIAAEIGLRWRMPSFLVLGIILMSSDLMLEPLIALNLYAARVRIESIFASLKNLLGGLAYHFWSKYLTPVARRPRRGSHPAPVSSRPGRTANTIAAIQKCMALHLIFPGTLHLMAATFGGAVREHARCWLRTPSGAMHSDFISRTALANLQTSIYAMSRKTP